MIYLALLILFFLFMIGYIKWARKNGIIDTPNERSSHTKPTVRGAGIIFPLALLVWGVLFSDSDWLLIIAVLLIGLIGFLDDRFTLHQFPRLAVQSLSVLLLLYVLGAFNLLIVLIIIGFVCITGWLNTFNFMDGINGISTLYASSIIIGVYIFRSFIPEISESLIYTIGIALFVFGFFNVRNKALCFAGDVGSLSLGFILAFFVSALIITTSRWEFILFLSVYGIDSVLTIVHRLIKKENIFEAHRSHLYQYLANEMKWSHIRVSVLYSLLQLAIIGGLFLLEQSAWALYAVCVLSILCMIYILAKRKILNTVESV